MRIKKNRLRNALSKGMHKNIRIHIIKNVQEILAPSRNFDVVRFTVDFRRESRKRNEKLNLVSKRLKPSPPKTDFSGKLTPIHREIESIPDYTRMLFEYLQGPINDGQKESYLVRFYGHEGREIYEEDAGDISVERLFITKTPDSKLLEELVNAVAVEHSRWAINLTPHINKLYNLRKEEHFREKLHDNLDVILDHYEIKLEKNEEEVLGKLFLSIDENLNNPDFNIFIRLIHSDLHLGHIFLKYNSKKFADVEKMSEEDLKKYKPEIKLVDVSGMSIGPQTFDIVDMLKHPVAVNANEYPTQKDQRGFIEDLVKKYRTTRVEEVIDAFSAKIENGVSLIERDLEFLTLFYVSNVYRDIRAAAKGILLKSKHPKLYKIYQDLLNQKYELYYLWYLADLGETLRYLSGERFKNWFKDNLNPALIEKSYDVLSKYLKDKLEASPIKISREIVSYSS